MCQTVESKSTQCLGFYSSLIILKETINLLFLSSTHGLLGCKRHMKGPSNWSMVNSKVPIYVMISYLYGNYECVIMEISYKKLLKQKNCSPFLKRHNGLKMITLDGFTCFTECSDCRPLSLQLISFSNCTGIELAL